MAAKGGKKVDKLDFLLAKLWNPPGSNVHVISSFNTLTVHCWIAFLRQGYRDIKFEEKKLLREQSKEKKRKAVVKM